MLKPRILNRLPQIVHFTQVFFPLIVDDGEGRTFFYSKSKFLTVRFQRFFNVYDNLKRFFTVRKWHCDVFKLGLGGVDILNDWQSCFTNCHHPVSITFARCFVYQFLEGIPFQRQKFFLLYRRFNAEKLNQIEFETVKVFGILVVVHNAGRHILKHGLDVELQAFAKKGVLAPFVNDFALGVHHVIVFKQALANTKIVFLHLALGAFDGFCDHRMLDHFTFLESQPVHHFRNPVGAEKTHQVVFERNVKL